MNGPKKLNPQSPSVKQDLCDSVTSYLKHVDKGARTKWKGSIGGESLPEALPTFIELKSENVIKGENNTYIVLGRDRPGSSMSGNQNSSQAGAIDIVVGRMGGGVVQCNKYGTAEGLARLGNPGNNQSSGVLDSLKNFHKTYMAELTDLNMAALDKFLENPLDIMGLGEIPMTRLKKIIEDAFGTVYVHPMFSDDAARIYISQKSEVDENFDLVAGKVGSVSKARHKGVKADWGPGSCVAVKADDVRIISRRGIKLVTMQPGKETTSTSTQTTRQITGINIIAGNKTDGKWQSLQPIVKGTNLVECLENMQARINELSGILGAFLTFQHNFNAEVSKHNHTAIDGKTQLPENFVLSKFTGPSVASALMQHCQKGLDSWKKNMGAMQLDTLKPNSEKYICSRWNFVN